MLDGPQHEKAREMHDANLILRRSNTRSAALPALGTPTATAHCGHVAVRLGSSGSVACAAAAAAAGRGGAAAAERLVKAPLAVVPERAHVRQGRHECPVVATVTGLATAQPGAHKPQRLMVAEVAALGGPCVLDYSWSGHITSRRR